MKRIISILAMCMMLSLLFTGVSFASEMDYDTMTEWDLKVAIPDGLPAMYNGGNFYIYGQAAGSIPYVMVRCYTDFEDEYDFINNYFTDYMKEQYSDLEITDNYSLVIIEGREFYEIDYGYTVEGYQVTDRRIVKTVDDRTYMFASKEVEELDMTLGSLLQVVCAESVFLRDGEPIPEEELQYSNNIDNGYPEVRWEYVEQEVDESELTGSFVTFEEVGFEMFVFDSYQPSPIPEGQMAADTFIGFFVTPQQDAYVSVQYLPIDFSLEEYKEFLQGLGSAEDITDFLVNDEHFVLYFMPESDIMALTTYTGEGILEFTFYPDSDGDYSSMAEIMGASIRKVQ